MSLGTSSQNDAPTVTEMVIGAVAQIVYLFVVIGFLLLLPPFLSYVTPFSFPLRNAFLIFSAAIIVIGLVVALDVILQMMRRN